MLAMNLFYREMVGECCAVNGYLEGNSIQHLAPFVLMPVRLLITKLIEPSIKSIKNTAFSEGFIDKSGFEGGIYNAYSHRDKQNRNGKTDTQKI